MNKEDLLKLIGEDRDYEEYRVHRGSEGKAFCICADCNFTRGYNKRGEIIKSMIEDYLK